MNSSISKPAAIILDFIGKTETIAGPKGYETIYGKNEDKLPKPYTKMTVNEVIRAGKGWTSAYGSSASGRYQFMKATLSGLKTEMGLSGNEVMTPDFQDRLGMHLLVRRGFNGFISGAISLNQFGLNLAKEWASFPVLASTKGQKRTVTRGQSYYAGDGLNKSLVKPEAVEKVLRDALAASNVPRASSPNVTITVPAEPAPIQAPRVTAEPPPVPVLPWWQRIFGVKVAPKVATVNRPGLHPNGDPALWDVQSKLKERAYYSKGNLDGLDGGLTQGAVAQIRKDNGMGDGGIDADFLARLDSFPHQPVSAARQNMSLAKASAHAPELFNPPKWLITAGLSSIGLGGASGSGLMDNVSDTVSRGNELFGQVQSAFALLATVVHFVVEHKTYFFIGLGLLLAWKGISALLSAWIKVRQAFF